MKPIGKITRDDYCTHSLVPYLFDKGHFKSKQEVLNDCIRARHGESIRTPQTLRQRTGDVLEKSDYIVNILPSTNLTCGLLDDQALSICNNALALMGPDKSGEIPHLDISFIFTPSIIPLSLNPTS